MSRRSKRQSVAARRRNARNALRAAHAGDVIAIGYDGGAYKVLVVPGDSEEGIRVFRGWWPWPEKDRWGQALWDPTPLHKKLGPLVSITWTAPGLPLHIRLRGIPRVRQSFSERRKMAKAA